MLILSPIPVVNASELTIDGIPETLEADEEFEISVIYSGASESKHWLRAVFVAPDYDKGYFGLIEANNGEWGSSPKDKDKLYGFVADKEGNWEGLIRAKAEITHRYYRGSGEYSFRLARYTERGESVSFWSNEAQIYIAYDPPPTPTPTPRPSPAPKPPPSPKPSSTPKPSTNNQSETTEPAITSESEESLSEILSPQPTRRPRIAGYAAVATGGGIIDLTATNSATTSTATDSASTPEKNNNRNYIIWLGIILTIVSIGSVGFEKIKQRFN